MIYLDYNATAPYSKSVIEYIKNDMVNDWANPSSEHDAGFDLSNKIKSIRSNIADFLGVSSKSIIFTSSATESINTVLSIENLKKNKINTIVTSKLEHHATLDQCKWLESQGFTVKWIKNNQQGVLDLCHLEELLGEGVLLSILYVNNETGVINPISEISKLCRKNSALLHIDAVQALGKIKFNIEQIDIDFASFAGHKIGAMKGIGLLYIKEISNLAPLMHGGGQERSLRPSTLNYPAIKSFELALKDIDLDSNIKIQELRNYLEKELLKLDRFSINCNDAPRVGNTSNIYLGGIDARSVLLQLSRKNIMVSTGSACSSGSYEPSHVLKNLGYDRDYSSSCVRVSLGKELTKLEIVEFLNTLIPIINPNPN